MISTNNIASKKNYILIFTLSIIAILFALLSTNSRLRNFIQSKKNQTRQILGKTFATISERHFVIFKVKTELGIEVEIYEKTTTQNLKQKFSLVGDTEAFLMVNNNSINLGLEDIDRDEILDLIVPTVDKNGNSRLNIFKYDTNLNQFTPTQAE